MLRRLQKRDDYVFRLTKWERFINYNYCYILIYSWYQLFIIIEKSFLSPKEKSQFALLCVEPNEESAKLRTDRAKNWTGSLRQKRTCRGVKCIAHRVQWLALFSRKNIKRAVHLDESTSWVNGSANILILNVSFNYVCQCLITIYNL